MKCLDAWSLCLDVSLPARKQSTEVVCIPRLLDQVVDLAGYTQLNSVLETRQFLSQTKKNALSHFVHRLSALLYTPFHSSVNTRLHSATFFRCWSTFNVYHILIYYVPTLWDPSKSKWVSVEVSKEVTNLLSAETRIGSLRFQAGCCRKRLNLNVVFLGSFYVVVYFYGCMFAFVVYVSVFQ